jgi:hypothetical protein
MGKRLAAVESFGGNVSFMQRKITALYSKKGEANHANRTQKNSRQSSEGNES